MSERPPLVDFSEPYSELKSLRARQQMLRGVVDDIRAGMRDIDRYETEGQFDAGIAAAWAATLMVCDILRIGLSAADKRAGIVFSQWDKAVQSANRILKMFGSAPITSKADLMKSLNPELASAAQATETLRQAAAELRKLKVPTTNQPIPVKLPKEAGLIIDLGIAMAQDTILLLQAGQLQRQVSVSAAQSRAVMRNNLNKVLQQILLIEGEITREFERVQRKPNMA